MLVNQTISDLLTGNASIEKLPLETAPLPPDDTVLFFVVFSSVLLLLGLPGNILVLVVYTRRFPPSPFREIIRALGLLDLCTVLLGVPLALAAQLFPWIRPQPADSVRTLLKIAEYVNYTLLTASIGILKLISWERHKKICYPLQPSISTNKARVWCGLGTVIAFGVNVFVFFSENGTVFILHLSVLASGFLVLIVCMVRLYILMWRHLRADANRLRQLETGGETISAADRAYQNAQRTFKMSLVITLVFFLTILPHVLTYFIRVHQYDIGAKFFATQVQRAFLNLAILSPFINTVVNPFIYSFVSPKFRKEAAHILRGLRPRCN